MKVLVSYLGRRQAFSLRENDTMDKMIDLKQQVSLYFEIPSGTLYFNALTKNGILASI